MIAFLLNILLRCARPALFGTMSAGAFAAVALDDIIAPVSPDAAHSNRGNSQGETGSNDARDSESPSPAPTTFTVLEKDLINLIEQQIEAAGRPQGQLALTPGRPWPGLRLKGDSRDLRLELSDLSEWRSRMNIAFRIYLGADLVGSWSLPFRCAIYDDVFFTRRPLHRTEIPDYSELDIRRINLMDTRYPAVPADSELHNYELRGSIPAGRMLSWRDLQPVPLVRKGDRVEVRLFRGPLEIVMDALSLQDGGEGETVLLRNIDSNRRFSGTVIADQTVQIQL